MSHHYQPRYTEYTSTSQSEDQPGHNRERYTPLAGVSYYEDFEGGHPDRPPRGVKNYDFPRRSRSREELNGSPERIHRSREHIERSRERLDRSRERLDGSMQRMDRSRERLDDGQLRLDRSREKLDRIGRSRERIDRIARSREQSNWGRDDTDRGSTNDSSLDRRMRNAKRGDVSSMERRMAKDRERSYRTQQMDNSAEFVASDFSLDRREARHYDKNMERKNRSLDRALDCRDRRIVNGSVDRREQTADGISNRRERSMETNIDMRGASMDRMDRRRDRSMNGSIEVNGRSVDRRSRSREDIHDVYGRSVLMDPLAGGRGSSLRGEYTERQDGFIRGPVLIIDEDERRAASRAASEIYANARVQRPQSQTSHYTYRSGRGGSDVVSVKTKTTANGKLVMETMTAPHPCCPNTRSCCCLMVLLNLGLMLLTLGFVVVLQLYEPPFVWYVGLSMVIFGFLVLFGSLIYCVVVCREVEKLRPPPGELYWTNHWSKTVHVPEIHYSNRQNRPADYRGSEFSFKTDHTSPSHLTGNHTSSSLTRY